MRRASTTKKKKKTDNFPAEKNSSRLH